MWQEELAEIARLVGQLPDVKVRIEADNYTLTDVAADLPGLGQRVSYFTVTALRPDPENLVEQHEVVSVKLAKRGSHIEAADPDLPTLGLIGNIEAVAKSRRRLPAKLEPFFHLSFRFSATDLISGPPSEAAVFTLVAGLAGAIFGVLFGIGAVQHLVHPHHKSFVAWPASIWVAVPALLLAAVACFGWYRARTTLFTAPHQAAPTFWERNRATIVITAIFSALSLVAGLLIGQG